MADKGWIDSNTFSVPSIESTSVTVTSLVTETQMTFDNLTANRAVISDASKNLISSPTTDTELGYLSGVTSAVQTQLNGKQAAGNYITALTGDATASGPGSAVLTLSNTAVTPGSYGSASEVPVVTVDSKGRLTSITTASIPTGYTDEQAQDAVGAMVNSTLTYVDGTPSLGVTNNTNTQKVKVSKAGTLQGTRQEINFIQGPGITINTVDNSGSDRMDVTVSTSLGTKSVLFEVCKYDKILNNYNLDKQAASAAGNFSFVVPHDFASLVSLHMILVPQVGAAGTGKNIDLYSSYGNDGESMTMHSESNTTSTYNLGTTNTWTKIDLSSVFSSLTAGDRCGLTIETMGIGGEIYMIGILMVYNL